MVRQKFKGQVLTRTKTVNNILRVFNDPRVEAETGWYDGANAYANKLANKFGVSPIKVAGVLASLSPLKSWDENKRIAKSFLTSGNAYHTKTMKVKAENIVALDDDDVDRIQQILNGNKIKSFFLNIAFPDDDKAVTIDRHALCVALGRNLEENEIKDLTDNQYRFFVQCYKIAAKKKGIKPNEMQAITWVKWRKLKTLEKYKEIPF